VIVVALEIGTVEVGSRIVLEVDHLVVENFVEEGGHKTEMDP